MMGGKGRRLIWKKCHRKYSAFVLINYASSLLCSLCRLCCSPCSWGGRKKKILMTDVWKRKKLCALWSGDAHVVVLLFWTQTELTSSWNVYWIVILIFVYFNVFFRIWQLCQVMRQEVQVCWFPTFFFTQIKIKNFEICKNQKCKKRSTFQTQNQVLLG